MEEATDETDKRKKRFRRKKEKPEPLPDEVEPVLPPESGEAANPSAL
jgi:hypothetical protein